MKFKKKQLSVAITAITSAALFQPVVALGQEGPLEEITVTATRRAGSVQDVPYNISAISGEAIRRQGAFDVTDITRSIPGVAGPDLGSRAGVNSSIIMRGINVADPGQGTVSKNLSASAVSTYINDTPLFTNFRMVDIERVEVLRGPQGTLYGASAMGGTLRFITRKPQLDSRTAEITAGLSSSTDADDLNYELQGIFNLPISDTVAVRAAVSYEDRGGVVDAANLIVLENGIPARVNPADPDSAAVTTTANDVDTAEVLFGRFSLLWAPSDNTELNFNYLHQNEEWGHSTATYIGSDTSIGGGVDAYQDTPKFLDTVDRDVDLASLDIEHDFGFASFTSASSYSVDDSTPDRDTSDFYETLGPTYYLGYPRINALDESAVESKVLTQEFRLVSSGDNKFDWVVGAYYQKEEITQDNRNAILGFGEWADDPNSSGSQIVAYYYGAYGLTTVGDFIEFGLGGVRPSTNGDESFTANYASEFTDLAAFGEVTWNVSDQWQMTVGGRFFNQDLDANLLQRLPYCGAGCSDDGMDPNGSTRAVSTSSFDDQIFKFNTSYDFSDSQKVYLTVSEGFRRGGANALPQAGPFFDPGFSLTYAPDTLLNTEIGLKGSLLENRLTYSAAIYQINWDDVQIETFNAAGFRGVVNGGEAETQGIELEATAALGENFTATVGLSFVDAEITESVVIADRSIAGLPNDVVNAGDPLPYVPDTQASIALNYNLPLSNGLVLDLNLDGNYRSSTNSQINDTLFFDNYLVFDSYAQWNTTMSLSGEAWRATLWARNLTDETGLSSALVRNANVSPASEFGRRGFVSRPRTVGVRFTYFFD